MDGKNNGKPYEQMDDLGGKTPLFLVQHPFEDEASLITLSKKNPDDWVRTVSFQGLFLERSCSAFISGWEFSPSWKRRLFLHPQQKEI